jgi:hypothetical protein
MMVGDQGQAGVTVKTAKLVEELKKNRTVHAADFEEANKGFRVAVIAELETMLKTAREGGAIERKSALTKPESHVKDYDRVIRMLEMCTKDEVLISEAEFQQYVQDDWSWKREFLAQTMVYKGGR